jgi:hypothetical protein
MGARGFAERLTVQDFAHRALHISALKRIGQPPGYPIYPWPRSGQLIGSVRLWITDRYIQVSYKELDSQTNWRSVQETVLLDGGKRYWFRCPTCNRRAGTLFIAFARLIKAPRVRPAVSTRQRTSGDAPRAPAGADVRPPADRTFVSTLGLNISSAMKTIPDDGEHGSIKLHQISFTDNLRCVVDMATATA